MNGLNFVALDVETANTRRGSICAIGIAVVEEGRIAQTHSWLCQPPEMISHFEPFNVALHGISAERVANEPPFHLRISQTLAIIGDRPVIAHNAAFDMGAVREACDADELIWPTVRYGCTLVWARRELDLISYRLPMVANKLGIPLQRHHDASKDAEACAQILLTLAYRRGSQTVEEFAEATRTRLGALTPNTWRGCQVASSGGDGLTASTTNTDADPAHPLYGQVVVFTGALSMRRQDAWDAVAELGGTPDRNVTRRTTRLVIGDGFMGDDPADFHTGKAAKALRLRDKGQQIEVLTEADFESLIAEGQTSGTFTLNTPRRMIEFRSPDVETFDLVAAPRLRLTLQ